MKLKQVYLTSFNPEGLSDFYRSLGLEVRFADPGKWVQFQTEGAAFCIAGPGESAGEATPNAVAVFEVSELEPLLARARAAGAARISEVRDMGAHGRVAWIEDSEHNIVQFLERARPPA